MVNEPLAAGAEAAHAGHGVLKGADDGVHARGLHTVELAEAAAVLADGPEGEGLLEDEQRAVLLLQIQQLGERCGAAGALADALYKDEGPLGSGGLLLGTAAFGGRLESGLDGGEVAVRRPGHLRLAQPQAGAEAEVGLGVDDHAVARLHEGRDHARGRGHARRVDDGGLQVEEACDLLLQLEVWPARAVEAARTAGAEAVGVHRVLDRLLRRLERLGGVAHRVEETEVAARTGSVVHHRRQLGSREALRGRRRQGRRRPLLGRRRGLGVREPL
mmetsp:Transcript_50321/g.133063  ORF Transcript_50321/g.133063 Transcript_50321/m.133063 type:complete len:274 (+) Transcript_50321:686-1507(+)